MHAGDTAFTAVSRVGEALPLMNQQLLLDLLPPSPPSLSNFVVGANALAIQALKHCCPGRSVYLWGSAGAGKTHLLRALTQQPCTLYHAGSVNDALVVQPAMRSNPTLDLGLDTAVSRNVTRTGEAVVHPLHALATADRITYDLIAIDDVDQLSPDGQTGLFALYNRWRELSGSAEAFSLVLAGTHSPMATNVREDLRTRLGWDLVFRLEQLSDENRAQALTQRAQERGLSLSPDVVNWVLKHYARDMGELTALLDALDRYSLQKHRAITVPLLKDLLASKA